MDKHSHITHNLMDPNDDDTRPWTPTPLQGFAGQKPASSTGS